MLFQKPKIVPNKPPTVLCIQDCKNGRVLSRDQISLEIKDQKSQKKGQSLQNKGTQNKSLPKIVGQNIRTFINKDEFLEISQISISKV